MKLLVLKGFNNYFNRKIKKYSEIDDYIANSSLSYTFSDINFNPNDGIITEQVLGSENQKETGGPEPEPLNWEVDGSPDYIIAYTQETIDDTVVNTIHSRWFVLECVRTRLGQYKLALKRDTIADHLEAILTNPCFIEKGYVKHTDPLIFNEENVSLNQIKNYKGDHPEVMLKDQTGVPWLVMYIAKNYKTVEEGGSMVEKSVPIEGKMTLDTSSVLDYSDLPWAGIESGANMSNTTKIRRIPGAGQINISPIIGTRINVTGWSKEIASPLRVNLRYGFNNTLSDWKYNKTTSNFSAIGVKKHTSSDGEANIKCLVRNDLNISTSGNTSVNWGTTNFVESFFAEISSSNPYIEGNTLLYHLRQTSLLAAMLYSQYGELGPTSDNSPENIAAIKSYLSGKKTYFEGNVTHSPVPGQSNMEAYVGGPQSFVGSETLLSYNNKIVTFDNINYYKIKISRKNNYTRPIDYFTMSGSNIARSTTNNLRQYLMPGTIIQSSMAIDNLNNTMVETFFEHGWFDIQYEKVASDLLRFTLPQPSSRIQLNDAAYDMICFPYGAIDVVIPNDGNTQDITATTTKEAALGIARSIAAEIGSAMYDLQLLPYCPYREVAEQYERDGFINLGLTSPFPYSCWSGVYKIGSSGETPSRSNTRSFGLWCPQSHGTFDIIHTIEMPEENSEAYKVFNACKKFRLVAPNYSSIFEFNPLKNGGVTVFNVDYNYRPFNPYIHIAPTFDGLYGVDTNDNRGLILQGDFSVGYYSDKWAEYQIQNANYSNIFDRQLANIDTNQKLEREQTRTQYGWNIASEFMGLGGGLKGASAAPPGWGTLIGGIAGTVGGGVGSIIGAKLDERWMNWRLDEERSYAIDMYNLNLGNVKAQPYGLAKSDALTENFKYFPFIEEYDCTDKEVEIFKSKLKYDGMTVDAIGTIADYLPEDDYEFQKVKGRMIMIENIVDDFRVADDIYTEVNKGFYYVPNYVEPEGE